MALSCLLWILQIFIFISTSKMRLGSNFTQVSVSLFFTKINFFLCWRSRTNKIQLIFLLNVWTVDVIFVFHFFKCVHECSFFIKLPPLLLYLISILCVHMTMKYLTWICLMSSRHATCWGKGSPQCARSLVSAPRQNWISWYDGRLHLLPPTQPIPASYVELKLWNYLLNIYLKYLNMVSS